MDPSPDLPNYTSAPVAATVGDLIKILQQMPSNTILQLDGMDYVEVSLCDSGNMQICLLTPSRGPAAVFEGCGH